MALERQESRTEYNHDPRIKALQATLKKALEKLGHTIVSMMSTDNSTIHIETDKASIHLLNFWIPPKKPRIIEGEMLIGRHLTPEEDEWRMSTIHSDDPDDHNKLQKLVEGLKGTVFTKIEQLVNPEIKRLHPKFTFEFAIPWKSPKITAATGAVHGEIQKTLGDTSHQGPLPQDDEDFAWTVEK